jgi:hypothetical protein
MFSRRLSSIALVVLAYLFLIPPASATAQSAPKRDVLVLSWSTPSESHDYRVPLDRLLATKSWSMDQPLPLSVANALSIARKSAALKDPKDFLLMSISLLPHRLNAAGDTRWLYDIEFYNAQEAYGDEPPFPKRVVVLMDGSVVEGVTTPRRE